MPLFWDFVVVLLFASLAMLVLAASSTRYRAWPTAMVYFLLIFFGTWALAAWFEPIGIPVSGVFWVPFALTALLLTLFVAAVESTIRDRGPGQPDSPGAAPPEVEVPTAALGCMASVVFWIFIGLAVVSIVSAYI